MLILLPIVTVPIVSNALGSQGIGIYNFINSITNYFVLFAGLGIANYGVREISLAKDDPNKLSKTFWEIEILNAGIAFIVFLFYLFFAFFQDMSLYYYFQSLVILGTLLDISWYYQGIEDFKHITMANFIVKIVSFMLILFFVNSYSDLWIYILIQSANILVSQIILWLFVFKKIFFVNIDFKGVFSHLYPACNYFISKIATTIYLNVNKTTLGLMVSSSAVGIFTNTTVIPVMVNSIIGAADMVLLPRMTDIFKTNEDKGIRLLDLSLHIQLFLTIPIYFGFLTINEKFINWFLGPSFSDVSKYLPLASTIVIIIPLGASIVRQYLVPKNEIRFVNVTSILAAIINVITGFALIYKFSVLGAVVSNVITEFFVTISRISFLRKKTSFKFNLSEIVKFSVSGFIMFFSVSLITSSLEANMLTTFIQIILGVVIYLIFCYVLKSKTIIQLVSTLKK
ncbi:hypothetical protein RV10_GL002928 [Enterococcus pallens]|nr:hypothetical protein RV10_GL002928 [Enterococcus pallens]